MIKELPIRGEFRAVRSGPKTGAGWIRTVLPLGLQLGAQIGQQQSSERVGNSYLYNTGKNPRVVEDVRGLSEIAGCMVYVSDMPSQPASSHLSRRVVTYSGVASPRTNSMCFHLERPSVLRSRKTPANVFKTLSYAVRPSHPSSLIQSAISAEVKGGSSPILRMVSSTQPTYM
ncbi:3133_t:CDS:2 [Acaulospora colombiana]|uniref:3133_t:CDS:1 n=1 Tax=Acaulospora colombiana TaxID=27376 RepID=A0ACA9MGA4_9GLOM|nr:3133_t:CDS:2 [Acaulospora colombiana]